MGPIEPVFRSPDQDPRGARPGSPETGGKRPATVDVSRLRRSLDSALHDGTALAARRLDAEADALDRGAADRLADAGAILIPRRHYWSAPDELWLRFERADHLVAEMQELEGRLAQRRMRHRSPEREQLESARRAAMAELRGILVEVARVAGPRAAARIPEARPIYEEVGLLTAEAQSLRQRADDLRSGTVRQDPEEGYYLDR